MKALISVRREERPRGYFLETDQSGINVFNLMLSPVNTVISEYGRIRENEYGRRRITSTFIRDRGNLPDRIYTSGHQPF